MSVSANQNEDIMLAGAPCSCGGQFVYSGKQYSPEYVHHEEKCTHGYPYGTDAIYAKNVSIYYKCNRCGFLKTFKGYEISKTICHGYNAK